MSKEDKYWEYDEIEENYKLHFTRFYEDEIIATVFEDEEFSQFYADYELENVSKVEGEPYVLDAETIEEAKLEAEEKILELVQELDDGAIFCLDEDQIKFVALGALEHESSISFEESMRELNQKIDNAYATFSALGSLIKNGLYCGQNKH